MSRIELNLWDAHWIHAKDQQIVIETPSLQLTINLPVEVIEYTWSKEKIKDEPLKLPTENTRCRHGIWRDQTCDRCKIEGELE